MLEGANIKLGDLVSDFDSKSARKFLELIIGKPDFTVDDVKKCRHKGLIASAEELFESLEGIITPLQREMFSHVMRIIKEQTKQIEYTDSLVNAHLTGAYEEAVRMLAAIP